jgi:hypothetical protein
MRNDFMNIVSLKLICYGKKSFINTKFKSVSNGNIIKPVGGLWASPIRSIYGWKDWCMSNEWELEKLTTSFEFDFIGKTIIIDSEKDLSRLIWRKIDKRLELEYPDFEATKKIADAIFLTAQGERSTRYTFPRNLYGWDCESIFIMNPETIYPLKHKI